MNFSSWTYQFLNLEKKSLGGLERVTLNAAHESTLLCNTWVTFLLADRVAHIEGMYHLGRGIVAVVVLESAGCVKESVFMPRRKQVCWDAQSSDAAEVARLLVNYNWDSEPSWTGSSFPWISAHFANKNKQEWFSSPCFRSREPWRPRKASVMLSGKRGFCSNMSSSILNGRIN